LRIKPLFGKRYTEGTLYVHVQDVKIYRDIKELDILPDSLKRFFTTEYPPTKLPAGFEKHVSKQEPVKRLNVDQQGQLADELFTTKENTPTGEVIVDDSSSELVKITDEELEKAEKEASFAPIVPPRNKIAPSTRAKTKTLKE
jgi:hypothetical protein